MPEFNDRQRLCRDNYLYPTDLVVQNQLFKFFFIYTSPKLGIDSLFEN